MAVVVLVIAFAACSGGGGDDDPSGDGGPGPGADTTDPVVGDRGDVEEVLLTLDDLPDGFVDLGLHYSTVEICGLRTEMPEQVLGDEYPTGAAAFAVDADPIMPDVLEKVVLAPAGTGADVFRRASAHLDMNCGSGGESDGLASLDVTHLAVPALGDESVARRVTIEELSSHRTVGVDIVYARTGDTIVAVGVVGPEGRTELLVQLTTVAMERATAT